MPRIRGDSTSSQTSMLSPDPTSSHFLTNHLWSAFLEKTTSDVTLRVSGSWQAMYHLHKVVIIQAGFFKSLFTAGFAEGGPSRRNTDRVIDITFDDENITRAAFEFCVARLYGGGPTIHIPSWLRSSPAYPLTSCYPWSLDPQTPAIPEPIPPDHQAGTPAFLLSLLATSVYLSLPTVASLALSSILAIIGPHTVVPLLNFACGKPITQMHGYHQLDQSATGLENLAEKIYTRSASPSVSTVTSANHTSAASGLRREPSEDFHCPLEELSLEGTKNHEEDQLDHLDSISITGSISDSDWGDGSGPSYHYGSVSDKVGEASVCWIARWGTDILTWEEAYWRHRGPESYSSEESTSTPAVSHGSNSVPLIWSSPHLSAHWISAVLSADSFFVRGEKERYDIAKRVVDLRRSLQGVREKDEKTWKSLFEDGIYYANMSLDDIMAISQDISPYTSKPYVSLSTIQAAHWEQSLLKHKLLSSTSGSPTSSPPRGKDLGITQTVSEVLSPTDAGFAARKFYFAVPGDTSLRLGDSGLSHSQSDPGSSTMEHLFEAPLITSPASNKASLISSQSGSASAGPASSNSAPRLKTCESNFFGLASSRCPVALLSPASNGGGMAATGLESPSESSKPQKWSPYPPFRFSVEFFDIDSLKEKTRLHSQTVWYAGSLFNVYTQIVRKKVSLGSKSSAGGGGTEIQTKMGIYLHRQSSVEVPPPASAPSLLSERVERKRSFPKGLGVNIVDEFPAPSSSSARYSSSFAHNRGPSLPEIPVARPGRSPPAPALQTPPAPAAHSPLSRSTTPGSVHGGGSISTSLPSSVSSPNGFPLINNPSTPTMMTTSNTLPATAQIPTPSQPYRDPRSAISAYFAISCASAVGTSQTRFTSSPDSFAISQSWGWTSSSLRTDEFLDISSMTGAQKEHGKEVSLRATVTLGLV